MKSRGFRCLSVLLISFWVVGQAGGGVIYSNFGPGMAFDTNPFHGWTINGFLAPAIGQQAIAHQFTPAATETFTSAQVALTLVSGPSSVAVFVQEDSNGLPGPILEQISLTGLTGVPTIFSAPSVLHPQLQAGTPYWLTVVAGGPGVLGGWSWNSIGDSSTGTNFAATQAGSPTGPWGLSFPGTTRSAFQVNGIPLTFDTCLQDDSSRDTLRFDSTTGDYEFTKCGSDLVLSGTGSLTKKGNIIALQHYATDRRVLARIDGSINKGMATIQVFSLGTTFTIADRDTITNLCACP